VLIISRRRLARLLQNDEHSLRKRPRVSLAGARQQVEVEAELPAQSPPPRKPDAERHPYNDLAGSEAVADGSMSCRQIEFVIEGLRWRGKRELQPLLLDRDAAAFILCALRCRRSH
jgi:hypothetical protein